MINFDSPVEIREVLKSRGIGLKKRWGQNFLINRGAREKIVEILAPEKGELIWEIGPGLGALTEIILDRGVNLLAFEIDRGLVSWLEEVFGDRENLKVIQGDFLKSWKKVLSGDREIVADEIFSRKKPERVTGNLPYSCSSQIILSFIEGGFLPPVAVFTLQKELVKRMMASPSTKEYSSFSVLCQYAFEIEEEGELQAGSFYPAPEVTSAVVKMIPRKDILRPLDEKFFFKLVKSLFASRRKTLRNNLLTNPSLKRIKKSLLLDAVEIEGVNAGVRSEELSPEVFVRISNRILELKG